MKQAKLDKFIVAFDNLEINDYMKRHNIRNTKKNREDLLNSFENSLLMTFRRLINK